MRRLYMTWLTTASFSAVFFYFPTVENNHRAQRRNAGCLSFFTMIRV